MLVGDGNRFTSGGASEGSRISMRHSERGAKLLIKEEIYATYDFVAKVSLNQRVQAKFVKTRSYLPYPSSTSEEAGTSRQ